MFSVITFDQWIRIAYGLIFFGIGLVLLWWPACFAAVCPYFARLALRSDLRERLDDAACARKDAEGIPMRLGLIPGSVGVLLGILTFATTISVAYLYAALCMSLALPTGFAVLRARSRLRRRAAQIIRRDPFAPVPAWVYAVAMIAVLAPLFYLNGAPTRILVTLAGLAILALAWLVAQAPALLDGGDGPMDAFVDARLRRYRAGALVGLCAYPGFVAYFQSVESSNSVPQALAFFVVAMLIVVLALRTARIGFAGLTEDEETLLGI